MSFEKCPICGKAVSVKDKPFCSPRCATIDLGRWLGEKYVVPTQEEPDDDKTLPIEQDDA